MYVLRFWLDPTLHTGTLKANEQKQGGVAEQGVLAGTESPREDGYHYGGNVWGHDRDPLPPE